ncbi:unnamed protein product [Amoebophrya sp. A25]|nr:unnamed protein product [Amoebophrya sp. A25]|eukprot:GSA25T00026248001.1
MQEFASEVRAWLESHELSLADFLNSKISAERKRVNKMLGEFLYAEKLRDYTSTRRSTRSGRANTFLQHDQQPQAPTAATSGVLEQHARLLGTFLDKMHITGVVPSRSRPFIVQLPTPAHVEAQAPNDRGPTTTCESSGADQQPSSSTTYYMDTGGSRLLADLEASSSSFSGEQMSVSTSSSNTAPPFLQVQKANSTSSSSTSSRIMNPPSTANKVVTRMPSVGAKLQTMSVYSSRDWAPSFLRARLIRGIGYADSRVIDENGLLWFDLARGMVDVQIKAPMLAAFDPFYERYLAKGIEIYDFSHHTAWDFDAQNFEPGCRMGSMRLSWRDGGRGSMNCGRDGGRGSILNCGRDPDHDQSTILCDEPDDVDMGCEQHEEAFVEEDDIDFAGGSDDDESGETTTLLSLSAGMEQLVSGTATHSCAGEQPQSSLLTSSCTSRENLQEVNKVKNITTPTGSTTCPHRLDHTTSSIIATANANSLEAQIEDSILCSFGSPFLVLREDERLWKTPKIEKRFARWALLLGALVMTSAKVVPTWKLARKIFVYLGRGLVRFFDRLGTFLHRQEENNWDGSTDWMVKAGSKFIEDVKEEAASAASLTIDSSKEVTLDDADRRLRHSTQQEITAAELDALLSELDPHPSGISHTSIYPFLQPVAVSTLKARRDGRLLHQALRKYYEVIGPAVEVLNTWAEVASTLEERKVDKAAFSRADLENVSLPATIAL